MKWTFCAVMVAPLIACGADGEPVQPTRNATISLSDSGLSGGIRMGVGQGPASVSLGLGL